MKEHPPRWTRSRTATASARYGHVLPPSTGPEPTLQADSQPSAIPSSEFPPADQWSGVPPTHSPSRFEAATSSPMSSYSSSDSVTHALSPASSHTTQDSTHDRDLDSSCFIQYESTTGSEGFNPWAWASNPQQSVGYYGTAYGLCHPSAQKPAFPAAPYPALARGHVSGLNVAYKRREIRYSPYNYTKPTVLRGNLLQAWRARAGLSTPAPSFALVPASSSSSQVFSLAPKAAPTVESSRLPGPRGASLPLSVLSLIVRHMLDTAPPNIRPRKVLSSLALTSKRMRSVVAPHIYDHVILRANGDAGIYARANCSKHVRYVFRLFFCTRIC